MLGVKLVLVAVFAFAGYQESGRFARTYGRSPWGWPDWLWGLVCGISFVIGIVLLAIAERVGRNAAKHEPMPPAAMPPPAPIGQYGPPPGEAMAYGISPPPANPYGSPPAAPPPAQFGDTILPG
jgi:hypothetical protein